MSIIKSLSVGNGDMFYIKHGSDSFSIIDCCMNESDREDIVNELKNQSKNKKIKRFLSTHPDDDHIKGLQYLNEEFGIQNFYCVKNQATKKLKTNDFKEYCNLRDSDKAFYLEEGCRRNWLNRGDDESGSSGIEILWPVTTNQYYRNALREAKRGASPNNISPIIKYSLQDSATVLWMGDLETEFMKSIEYDVYLGKIDILFAPHHGRDSGTVPKSWLNELKPSIIVIGEAPSEYLNYYQGFNTIKQNSAGDLLFECVSGRVHIYAGTSSYREDFLNDYNKANNHGLYYIGTLNL